MGRRDAASSEEQASKSHRHRGLKVAAANIGAFGSRIEHPQCSCSPETHAHFASKVGTSKAPQSRGLARAAGVWRDSHDARLQLADHSPVSPCGSRSPARAATHRCCKAGAAASVEARDCRCTAPCRPANAAACAPWHSDACIVVVRCFRGAASVRQTRDCDPEIALPDSCRDVGRSELEAGLLQSAKPKMVLST
jgi:hypothetical protein